jgi:hypothetical protein
MKLPGSVSKRFREKQFCDICETDGHIWKAPCWDEEDLCDVYYACKKCHDDYSCCDCVRSPDSFILNIWKSQSKNTVRGGRKLD